MSDQGPAWDVLFELRKELVAQARGLGLTREEAEDVASEAILRAAVKSDLDVVRAGGWLRVVTRRLAMDSHRRHARCKDLTRLVGPEPAVIPQCRVDDRMEADWVAGLVDRLPERQKFVLQRRSEEMTPEAIATALGCSYKTVESLTSRGRATVRRALAATLGVAAGQQLAVRRTLRLGTGVPVMVAAATWPLAAITLVVVPPAAPAGPGIAVPASSPAGRDDVLREQFVTDPTTERAPTAASEAAPHRSRQHAPESTRVIVAPTQTKVIEHGGLTTTRDRGAESLLESTLRCLEHGPTLSASAVGCP